ncbi:MAG: redoxin domain-containing protein, partial [Vicinamibacterales bacterium]
MALRTFEEARPWARAIKEQVVSRKMPPWFATRGVGHFANDPSLADEEIATIAGWVDSGAPHGDPGDMPTPPRFSAGWQLGEPDYIIDLPRVEVAADGGDSFPSFTVTLDLPRDRWVRAIEIQPSNREVAHHASLLTIGGTNGSGGGQFAGRAVGTPPIVYPDGTGRWVRKGQLLRADLHYHSNGTATTDQTRVGLYFGHGELKKEVVAALVGNQMFEIPPHANNHEVRAGYIVDQDITLLWLAAHMHLRGKDMAVTAYFPDGRRQALLDVGAYDFNWQLSYYPKEQIALPRGTRIEVVAHYDNSTANRQNPDPTRAIAFGLGVTDEMMYSPFEFVSATGVSPTPSSVQS